MPARLTMNSRSLQETHPDVYRRFFAQHEIVVSAPGSFYWFGDHSDRYGELGIKQKVPLRGYVGLTSIPGESWTWGEGWQYIPSDGVFKKFVRQTPRMKNVAALLTAEAVKLNIPQACQLSTITEIPVSCGVASWAGIAAAIGVAMYLKSGLLTVDQVQRWSTTPTSQLSADGTVFDRVFRLAWKIEALHNADASSGAAVFTALVNSSLPIVYTTERRNGDKNRHPGTRVPSDVGDEYQYLDTTHYWGYRLDEFFGLKSTENWPIDFGLVYSGSTSSAEFAIRSAKDVQFELTDLESEIQKIWAQRVMVPHAESPAFIDRLHRQPAIGLWDSHIAALGTTSLEGLMAFKRLFDRGYTTQAVEQLFHAINRYQSLLKIFGVTTPTLRLMKHELQKLAIGEETTMAAKVTGTGLGGDILFVTPLYAFEHSIDHFMHRLREHVDPRAWLDYASWLDGYEERGVVVEQSLTDHRVSAFVSPGGVILRRWVKGQTVTTVLSAEEFEKLGPSFDVLIDIPRKTLCIKGYEVTSKEIHSRKATVAILEVLLKNLGKNVPASELPPSIYVDRTTMQGKIIGPLCEVIEARTKKQLPFSITGGLNKQFTLRLDLDGLTFGVVEKRLA